MDTTVKPQGGTGAPPSGAEAGLQPFLHESCVVVYAPSLAISRPDGQLSGGADGFYHGDRRALSRLEASVPAVPNAPISAALEGADRASFRTVLRGLAEHSADPAVTLDRDRRVEAGQMTETLQVVNAGRSTARLRLVVRVESDLARMDEVKSGAPTHRARPEPSPDGFTWADGDLRVRLSASPAPDEVDAASGTLRYDIELAAGARWRSTVCCTAEDRDEPGLPASAAPWETPEVTSADGSLDGWLRQSESDLRRLLLVDPQGEGEVFLAAGAPWFLTLFGRDSLWAARMLLPLGTGLAEGTLRTLARRQGSRSDPESEEQPGKILHEVRRDGLRFGQGPSLPPCYYGTVDATPLWLILLHDAWRWGMPPERVEELLPRAQAALEWMATHGDADGDGFLEYVDSTGRGLSNQGWKDSGDAVQGRDARIASPPIALCEVQGYAHEAAMGAAALLRAFDRPGADRWEEWAGGLRERFRTRFWVEDDQGPYPAMALDRDKRPVDSVASNMGHLLGTGLLNREESAHIVVRLATDRMDSGYGLRTLSSDSAGYNPLGYHTGSVWPHDTAIAVHGLVRAGFPEAAESLAAGLVTASAAFEGRLPELFSGHSAAAQSRPSPYPAACRPQAWAAAASVLVLQAVLGLEPDVPGKTLIVSTRLSRRYRPLRVTGLALAGQPLEVDVDAEGRSRVRVAPGITVVRRGSGS